MYTMPPRYTIRFVRSAIKEIQKLPLQHYNNVSEIIQSFRKGDLGDCKRLEGYRDLWRTRKGDTRVIWKRINGETLLVIKADARRDVYEGDIDSRSQDTHLDSASILGIEPEKIGNLPTHELPRSAQSLHQFFFGGYVYSPVLTEEQRQLFSKRQLFSNLTDLTSNRPEIESLLIQSGPGTGKTICATLIACDLYENRCYNIILILPENLCQDVQEYEQVKQIRQRYNNVDFFIGTLEEWIKSKHPELYAQIATLEEQRSAFDKEARRVHITDVDLDDLKLYTSFVYAVDETVNPERRIIYRENYERIQQLKKIRKENFCQNLNGKILRIDALQKLAEELKLQTQSQRFGTVFIIDEAQDYLLKEIKLIATMLKRWQTEEQHPTLLWLLGDINQRIQLVDFDWGDLHLNRRYSLRYNYRNTKHILELASIFYKFARESTIAKRTRALPSIANPEDAFEKGEPVKILEVPVIDSVRELLVKLSEKIGESISRSERYLLRKLAGQVHVIYMKQRRDLQSEVKLPNINYLSVVDAKGREFDGCIIVSPACNKVDYSLANNWYTAVTRPRQRLLVVMTPAEIETIGREKLQSCEILDNSPANLDALVTWVTQSSNIESVLQNPEQVIDMIVNQVPDLYFDTYSVLSLIRATTQQINEIESELIKKLKTCDVSVLENQLKEIESVSDIRDQVGLRCLILRALNRSWDAVAEASRIKNSQQNLQEYSRLIHAIAADFESQGLFYEAARVKIRAGLRPLEIRSYPFAEEFPWDSDSPLVSILCRLAVSKIRGRIQND